MIDPSSVPEVEPDELLARYILYSRHIRNSDGTIKADAFIPHLDELSVTRHRDATTDELWEVGQSVASRRSKRLHGRGDVTAHAIIDQGLNVVADPIAGDPELADNPNHANVTGWPPGDKDRQRLLALEIAKEATLVRTPGG